MLGVDEGTVTFYADLEGTKELEAKFYPNGTALSDVTIPDDPARSGYYFAGWASVKAEDTAIGYNYKQAMPDSGKSAADLADYPCVLADFSDGTVTGDMAFYPVFVKDRLNVKLVPGDNAVMGNGSDGKPQSTDFTVNIDEPIRMTGLLATTRAGYEQDGWYTAKGVKWNPDGTAVESTWWPMTPEYADSSTPVKHTDRPYNYYTVTLTAHWTPVPVTVVFDKGEHPANTTAIPDGSVALGGTLTLPDAPEAATNYRFTGWKIGDTLHSAGEVFAFDDWTLVTDGTAPVLNVTAQYVDSTTLYIEFNTNGGTAIEPISASAGETITRPADPTRLGHTFAGWYSDAGLTTPATLPTVMPAASATYYAKWTRNQYTITYVLNGATNPTSIDPYTVDYDTAIPVVADPERTHYTFTGWSPEIPDKMPAKDLTVEAIWEPKTYSMTFKTNAEDVGVEITGIFGALVEPPADPTADHLTFVEWSIPSPIYMPDDNPIVTAKWKPDPKVSNETVSGKKDGKITGVTDEMEYSADGGVTWIPVPNGATEVTDLASGTYLVRFSKEDDYKSDAVTTVTIQPGKNEGGDTEPYPVNVAEPDNGSVKADKDNAVNGDKVTLTITPDNGYETDKVTVTDDDGKEIPVTKNADGKYSFNMPAGKVTVSVTFKKSSKPTPPTPVIPDGDYVTEPSYPVSVTGPDNGSVKADKSSAYKGEKVTLTITPDEGYEIANVKFTDSDGKEIPFTVNADGTYSFEMPASKVTVSVEFRAAKGALSPVSPADSGIADWLITDKHILYIAGYPEGDVRPQGNITRAETAMLFYRLLKDKNVEITVSFPDVNEGEWYAEAVNVLSSLNVFYGRTDGSFDPNEKITRAEFATAATRFAKAIQGKAVFSDVPEGYWAYDSIASAAAYGWVVGYEDDTFRPEGYITRAEVTAIVNRMLGRAADEAYISANRDNLVQFSDLQDPDAWYYLDMMEAANSHDFTVTDGSETWK